MIKAIIFDFDGLVLDTETPIYRARQEIYEIYDCSLPLSKWLECIGTTNTFDPCDVLEEQLGHPINRATICDKRRVRTAELMAMQSILPGVEDRIVEAKELGLKLGVGSSSPRSWVSGQLARLGLEPHFNTIKCSEDVERVKPDPALFLAVLRDLGVSGREALVLEDSLNGVTAAKRARIFCVAVPNALTQHSSFDLADLQLTSLAELSIEGLMNKTNHTAR